MIERSIIDNPFSLEGRTILIAGTSSGIGQALAVAVSKADGRVVALERDRSGLGSMSEQREAAGQRSLSFDLSGKANPEENQIPLTKGALLASVRLPASEYASRGIRFNAVCPTYVNTPMLDEIRSFPGEERFRTQIPENSPLGLLEPEGVADAVVFLLSPASKKITGTAITLSAGADPVF